MSAAEVFRPDRSPEVAELAKAMAAAQREVANAAKDSLNPHFNRSYADLASVWEACREPLTKNGLSVIQRPVSDGNRVGVTTTLLHSSGQWMESTCWTTPERQGPQAMGSCITYLRRYSLAAVAGIAPDDDDGEGAERRGKASKRDADEAAAREAYRARVNDEPKVTPPPVTGPQTSAMTSPPPSTGAGGGTTSQRAGSHAAPGEPDERTRVGGNSSPPNGTKKRNDSGAKDIVHDGQMATKKQVGTLHALRDRIPKFRATPDDPRSDWRKYLGVYRKQDGARIEHCNEMSVAQASHFIMRMQATVDRHQEQEEEIRAGVGVEPMPPIAPANFSERLHDLFPTAEDESMFFSQIGLTDADAVPDDSRAIVLELARAKLDNALAFHDALKQARDLGHVPSLVR